MRTSSTEDEANTTTDSDSDMFSSQSQLPMTEREKELDLQFEVRRYSSHYSYFVAALYLGGRGTIEWGIQIPKYLF